MCVCVCVCVHKYIWWGFQVPWRSHSKVNHSLYVVHSCQCFLPETFSLYYGFSANKPCDEIITGCI